MKKLLLLVVFVATTAISAFGQTEQGEKSVILQAGYQSDPSRLMLGVEGRYNITDNIRISPDVMFLVPNDKTTGLDINANVHYVIPLEQGFNIFPLAGIAMLNNRYSGSHGSGSRGFTNWGFNLGGGLGYNLSGNSFLNMEMKYTFSDADCFTVGFGYGFKF